MSATRPRAAIVGCAGLALGETERALFAERNPLGLILFARNVATPGEVRALVRDFRDVVGRDDAPVLIDQEGGRVQRLGPPHWRDAPAGARFAALAGRDIETAEEAVRLNARAIGAELAALGITVDCAPVLDMAVPGAHAVIGDRALGDRPEQVARLGRAAMEGFLAAGVLPVVKHIPGHGRATLDSHEALPRVDAARAELEATDFAPFRALRDAPCAMTAHVVYTAIDPDLPATLSPTVIGEVVRGHIGFDGFLLSDDIEMKALAGSMAERATGALEAGCDAVLHCSGDPAGTAEVLATVPALSDNAWARLERAEAMRPAPPSIDPAVLVRQLEALMSPVLG